MSQIFPIKAAYYRGKMAQAICRSLAKNQILYLRPEPDNPADPFAVQIICTVDKFKDCAFSTLEENLADYGLNLDDFRLNLEWHIGYIPRDSAGKDITRAEGDIEGFVVFDSNGKPYVKVD